MPLAQIIWNHFYKNDLTRFTSQTDTSKVYKNNSILNKILSLNQFELKVSKNKFGYPEFLIGFRSNIYKNYSFNKFCLKDQYNSNRIKETNYKIINQVFDKAWINKEDRIKLIEWNKSTSNLILHSMITYKENIDLISIVKTSTNKPFSYYCDKDKQLKSGDLVVYKQSVEGQKGSYFSGVKYHTELKIGESLHNNSFFKNIGNDNQLMKKYGYDMSSPSNINQQIEIIKNISVSTDITQMVKFKYFIIREVHDIVHLNHKDEKITNEEFKEFIYYYKNTLKELELVDSDYPD